MCEVVRIRHLSERSVSHYMYRSHLVCHGKGKVDVKAEIWGDAVPRALVVGLD